MAREWGMARQGVCGTVRGCSVKGVYRLQELELLHALQASRGDNYVTCLQELELLHALQASRGDNYVTCLQELELLHQLDQLRLALPVQ